MEAQRTAQLGLDLDTAGWTFLKVLGLIWTGLALSLGAPFWFDLLQKFMDVPGAR